MTKTRAYSAGIPVLLFIAIEITSVILFGSSSAFWAETVFSLAILALLVLTLLHESQMDLKIFGVSKTIIIGTTFGIQLLLSLLGAALKTESLPIITILSLLLASGAAAIFFAANASESHALIIENQVLNNSRFMQNLELQLRLLLDESPSELHASISHLLDAASFTDPTSCRESARIEDGISDALQVLSQSVKSNDIESANAAIGRLNSLIKQRTTLVKAKKDRQ